MSSGKGERGRRRTPARGEPAGADRAQASPRPRGAPLAPRRTARAAERLRPAPGDEPRRDARGRALRVFAVARPRRPALHGAVPRHRAHEPAEGAARPRAGLVRGHAGQLDDPAAGLGGKRQRPGRFRSRTPRPRQVVDRVGAVPGEPDERRSPLAGCAAHRRQARAAAHRPDDHGVSLMDIVVRAVIAFAFVFLLTRIVGRRELSSLEPFDLILLVMMGDLVQQGVTQSDFSVTGLVLAAGTIAFMTVLVSYLSFRFRRLRPILDGEPIVVVQDGKPIEANLKRERLTLEELTQEARLQQIASIDEVEWAVLEKTGAISFIKKSGS